MRALRIGIVGAGQISGVYLGTLGRLSNVQVVAVADLDQARARAAAAAAPGARPLAAADLFAAADVDLVLNLTIPAAHAEVARAAIAAGKHVYGEKPLAVTNTRPAPQRRVQVTGMTMPARSGYSGSATKSVTASTSLPGSTCR